MEGEKKRVEGEREADEDGGEGTGLKGWGGRAEPV